MISALCAVALLTSTASAQVQINCGGAASGSFIADADFTGGTEANTTAAITIPAAILNPAPQAVYQTERWGASTYTIPNLTPGQTYTVRLHFAEFYWTTAGQREFGVNINGAQVLPALPAAAGTFDIVATVGAPNTALVEAIQATANTAGQIVIQFIVGSADQPKISGIEVFASAPFGIDAGGVGAGTFMADLYFAGGTAATHSNAVDTSLLPAPVPPQEVLETERYGASTYTIPNLVPGQSYSVGLYFSENYFAAAGQREFNVSINGTAVLTNFDIYAATGAEYKAILKTYTATANAAGQIVIAFTNGAANNAKVDAIQIQSLNTTSPTIASLSPTSGLAGSAVTIAGTNFGATQGTSTVSFGTTTAAVTSWSATSISATVPALGAGAVNVTVSVGGVTSNAAAFTVTVPVVPSISSLTPASGPAGSSVTIAGTNFGATQGSSTVKFGATAATVTAWSTTSITATVPALAAGSVNVTVTVGGTVSNAESFSVAAPSISSLTPASGAVGSTVTIAGNNFGATQSTVSFGNTAATITTWSNTSITVTVPTLATGAVNVTVTVGGLTSNAVTFTVTPAPPFSLAIDCGGVGAGSFVADEDFTGGVEATHANTMDTSLLPAPVPAQEVLQTERYGNAAAFSYTIPGLTAGQTYSVWLYFDEGYFTAAGQREFGVTINGTQVLPALPAAAGTFDIVATAGAANKAIVEAFTATASSAGQIVINFTVGSVNNPKIDGIQIYSGTQLPPSIINSVTPASGGDGTPVTITGTNFGGTQGSSTVNFGTTAATVTSWSNTSIVVTAPNIAANSYNVSATVGGVASNSVAFSIVAPSITTITPASGAVGSSVTIAGSNFGASQGTSTLKFGTAAATVNLWSNTSITATVPSLPLGSSNVTVTVGANASNATAYAVAAPVLSAISPASGVAGSTVTLTGSNLGVSQGSSTVQFGSVAATVTSWSNTSVSATVPTLAAGAYNVIVTVGGNASNAEPFTVTTGPPQPVVSIDSGGVGASPFVADEDFTGGVAATHANAMDTSLLPAPVPAQEVLQTERYGNAAAFSYTIPGLNAGQTYSVWLYFDEGYFTAAGQREFGVTINGAQVLPALPAAAGTFDIVAAAGAANKAIVEAFTATASSAGQIVINFTVGAVNNPKVDAIQVFPGTYMPPPVIVSLSLTQAPVGAAVTITGTNFGATQGTSTVDFGSAAAAVSSWSNTSITATVPSSLSTGTAYPVTVSVGGMASNAVNITIIAAAVITGISPTSGWAGSSITISGNNFGSSQGSSTVALGTNSAAISSWSNTSITAAVPAIANGSYNLTVNVGGLASNAETFTVTSNPGIPISANLVGINDWYDLPDSIWSTVGASNVERVRIGGEGQNANPFPSDTNALDLVNQVQNIRSANAQPSIQVSNVIDGFNIGDEAAAAAAMVAYMNNSQTSTAPVKYWEIGNEPDWEETTSDTYDGLQNGGICNGQSSTCAAYIQSYIEAIAPAMRNASPTPITIIGPALAYWQQDNLMQLLIGGAYDITGFDSQGRPYIDVFDWHRYPFQGAEPGIPAVITEVHSTMPGYTQQLVSWISAANASHGRTAAAGNALTWAVTEFNMNVSDSGTSTIGGSGVCSFINGQLYAEYFGVGMKYSGEELDSWSVQEGGGACASGDLGYLSSNLTPRSSYYHTQMVGQYLLFNKSASVYYLAATSSNGNVGVISTTNGTQTAVMVLNEDTNAHTVSMVGTGSPAGSGDTQIGVPATIAAANYTMPAQSTMVLVYNANGALATEVTYSITNDENNQPPQIIVP